MKIETLFRIGLLGFAASTLLRCSDGAPSRISDAGSGMPSVSEPAKTDQATKSPENTDPKLKSQGLSIAEGDEASLKSLLVLTDQEDTDDNLEFTIVSDPLLGFIKRSGSKIGVGQTFTQKDLNEGLVNYTHNGRHVDSTLTDSFYFSYHDSVVTAPKNGTFKIAIAPYCSSKNFSSDHKKFGQGTFSNPYKICFAEQMNQIGLVSTDWSFHYELKADISLAAYTGTSYRIIGRSPTPFTGTFEGNNKTISNFTYSTINPQVGLFGYVENSRGFIRNLKVIDANVTCGPDCGIVVGINYGATISNIKTTGTVTGTGNRGGVYGTSSYSISSFLGSESQIGGDNAGAGGITGRHSIGRIFGASHVGNVTTKSANTGGIAGYAKLLLDNVYQVGNVGSSSASSSSYDVSGLSAGSLAKQSFYIGNVTGFWNSPRVEILASEVSDSYYSADSVCTNLGTGGCSIVGTSIPAAGGTFSNRSSSVFSNWDFDSVWEEVAGSYPRLNPKFSDDGNFNCSDHLSDAPFAGGSGTYQKPYLICTVAQFNAIGANSSKWDKYFKIMSDINMASISATAYKVIGSEAIPFTGFIDGNYKTIENLKVTGSTYVGMIGYGDSFIIRRLTVKNAVITGSGQVGTLTGQVRRYAGFIDINIVNTTITTTSGNVGGMVGFCNQCGLYNFAVTGNVSSTGATSRVGGVIGFFESGSAKSGYFSGAVAGVTSVGGFAGDNHTGPLISNVFVSANITGSGVNVGPFRGIHSSGDSNYQRAFYDSSKSCTGCASMGDAEPIAVTSTFYSKTNPQLDKMDFVNAWRERPDNFPELVMKEPK